MIQCKRKTTQNIFVFYSGLRDPSMHRRYNIFGFQFSPTLHPPTYACWISELDGRMEQNQQNNQNWITSVSIFISVWEKHVAVVTPQSHLQVAKVFPSPLFFHEIILALFYFLPNPSMQEQVHIYHLFEIFLIFCLVVPKTRCTEPEFNKQDEQSSTQQTFLLGN